MKKLILSFIILCAGIAGADETKIRIMSTQLGINQVNKAKIQSIVKKAFPIDQFREIAVQVMINEDSSSAQHLVVYLFQKGLHRMDVARINLDSFGNAISVIQRYSLTPDDYRQQPGRHDQPKCPDQEVQFISFCPNDNKLELDITKEVAAAAEKSGLKTVTLLKTDATRQAYLDYMSCPRLQGNFYDGDSNPEEFITNDGVITHSDFNTLLDKAFRFRVVNIWLACEAFNDPMLSAVVESAQAQKYAAGINNLLVGPSDKAGACTMEAALEGKPISTSFDECYKKYDDPQDHWGLGGKGSDLLGH